MRQVVYSVESPLDEGPSTTLLYSLVNVFLSHFSAGLLSWISPWAGPLFG